MSIESAFWEAQDFITGASLWVIKAEDALLPGKYTQVDATQKERLRNLIIAVKSEIVTTKDILTKMEKRHKDIFDRLNAQRKKQT